MKRLVRKVQSLGDQAARLSTAASQLPGRVAEIRQSVAATAGELRNLKSDIQFNVAELQMTSEDQLADALMEINTHTRVLEDAGFELEGVDLELSPSQRIVVHLRRIGDADEDEFRELIRDNQNLTTIRAILASLLKANKMAATVEIGGLDYHRVLIGIGANPGIRLCWRPLESEPISPPPLSAAAPVIAPAASSLFGGGESFFSTASTPPAVIATPEPVKPTTTESASQPPPLPAATPQQPPPLPPSGDPLARFKVMPSLGRRS
ncbi:MAG TPA: hypothetical protein VLO11_09760 [Luteolibacter sp.]|nr:hypothetical protein [Luteolibacter sp.]